MRHRVVGVFKPASSCTMSTLGFDIALSKSLVRVSNQATEKEIVYNINKKHVISDSGHDEDPALIRHMIRTEAFFKNAFSNIQTKINSAVIKLSGCDTGQISERYFKRLARDSLESLMCYGFVAVRLIKIPDCKEGQMVPIAIPICEIEWEADDAVGAIFACPRVFYKTSKEVAKADIPRIYVYTAHSYMSDVAQSGIMISVLRPYKSMLMALEYNELCYKRNMENTIFIEHRTREPVKNAPTSSADMTSVIEHTIRMLPRDTNSKEKIENTMDAQMLQRQMTVEKLMQLSEGKLCVLPDDCSIRQLNQTTTPVDTTKYVQDFEHSVNLALGLGAGQRMRDSQIGSSSSHSRDRNMNVEENNDTHLVLIEEVQNMLALFASAVCDPELGKKVSQCETSVHKLATGKRQRGAESKKNTTRMSSICIQSVQIESTVTCSVKPLVSGNMEVAMRLYEDGALTSNSFSQYIKNTTGLEVDKKVHKAAAQPPLIP